jgi:hypothetical protein
MEMSLAQARTLVNKEAVLSAIEESLMHVYGLCVHVDLDAGIIPPAARECRRCVAEHVADALSRKVGVTWDR